MKKWLTSHSTAVYDAHEVDAKIAELQKERDELAAQNKSLFDELEKIKEESEGYRAAADSLYDDLQSLQSDLRTTDN